jgi:hypothetical protein
LTAYSAILLFHLKNKNLKKIIRKMLSTLIFVKFSSSHFSKKERTFEARLQTLNFVLLLLDGATRINEKMFAATRNNMLFRDMLSFTSHLRPFKC